MKIQKLDSKILLFIKKTGIAVLLTGAAILFFACENNIDEIKAFSSPEDLPVLEANNFETTFTDSGQMRFFLKTPRLLRYENDGKAYIEFPDGMELVKYNAQKRIVSSITSDYAKQFVKEQKWEAKNNVIATNDVGDTLKTDQLIWDEKNEKIYSDVFVEIISTDKVITGIGFTSDQNLNNWKIKNPKGSIYVNVDDEGKPESNNRNINNSNPPVNSSPNRRPVQINE
ncbi:MAG: LPS export ABC transporter periplasmic protein LptC [Draconibacterium sp.]|nr:LPS export ABC transporter periplasmic protein LptC [Draconibacterium sp.]